MRTLYFRIVLTFIGIAVASAILGLLVTNVYYLTKLRDFNDQKMIHIATEFKRLYEQTPGADANAYLSGVAEMGFQIYVVNGSENGVSYGAPFKHRKIDDASIRAVLNGGIYNGMMQERHLLTVTGFFENSIRNSVGLPVRVQGETQAWFIRPNLEQQIGEVRVLVAVLLSATFLFSLVFIVILSRYIVRPVKQLTEATNRIVGGQYDIELDVTRKDEIGNLARHFTHMAQALKRLDAMRQEFVANVSHEIQSPLTSIRGFAQSILDRQASPEEQERYLRIIADESTRLSSLSKQLLTLAALDKETGEVKRASYRLDEQIRQVLIVTEWEWSEKQLFIEPELPEIVISGDADLLYQVWFNLITNSIKFCKPGDCIAVSITSDDGIVVTVRDTGPGISAEELPHIFDRFYKADKSRSRTKAGSGLGLAIVRKIVELHGGTIEASSAPGKDTIFTVKLPQL
ncbi:sensor histidine kinase [Paenibacillus ginsengarvi]|uniref:Heme sensor protein HssS n=1 Tax=Paenibacillus ginsengarvi TaxID=400777 RepID=A0A3B0CDK4_9BACL|nr:HAMP domain-containing sensor histidine kinase [Paenibacillus ginsengarvi]RKN84235.1 sensor histidine kinase [Paenibacillus ginsengarvi]